MAEVLVQEELGVINIVCESGIADPFETTQSYAHALQVTPTSIFNKTSSAREHKQVNETMAAQDQHNQPSSRLRIAIVGGGVGGLSLATFLSISSRSSEFDISIYETKPSLTEVGAGVVFWRRAWKILGSAGLAEDLKQLAPQGMDLDSIDDLQTAFEFRRGDCSLEGRSFGCMDIPFGMLMLHRADFQKALARHAIPPAKPHFGKKLIGYEYADEDDPSSEIILKFADGSTSQCDLLVGADGIRSVVRREMIRRLVGRGLFEPDEVDEGYSSAKDSTNPNGENVRGRDALVLDLTEPVWSGSIAYRGLVPLEALEKRFPGHRVGRMPVMYFGKSRHIVAYPILTHASSNTSRRLGTPGSAPTPTTLVNLVIVVSDPTREGTRLPQGEAWVRPATREEVLEKFRGWEEEVIALLELVEKPMAWSIHIVKTLPMYSDSDGRVAILGDAAHAMTPNQGAGGGQAVEGAYVLAALLTHPRTKRSNIAEVLRAYNDIRVPVAQCAVRNSRLAGMICEFNHAWDKDEDEDEGICKEMSEGLGFDREDEEMTRLHRLANVVVDHFKWVWEEDVSNQTAEAIRLFEEYLDK